MTRIRLSVIILLLFPLTFCAEEKKLTNDEQLLKNAGYAIDTDSLLNFFKKRTLSKEDHQTIAKLISQLSTRDWKLREQASLSLAKDWGPSVIQPLKQATKSKDLEVVRRAKRALKKVQSGLGSEIPNAAARLLVQRKCWKAIPILLQYLPYADNKYVEDTIAECLVKISNKREHPGLIKSLLSPEPSRRAIAAYVVGQWHNTRHRQTVQKLLNDQESKVRFMAAKGLVYGNDRTAVPTLIALLTDESDQIVGDSIGLLNRMAEKQSPPYPDVGSDWKKSYQQAWKKWWSNHAKKVDLTKLTKPTPQRGWILIAHLYDGQIVEVDQQNRKRWEIAELKGPLDAQILSENRILIAEYYGKRVTERNRTGEILWEKKLENGPVTVQRLSNGNTFIVTYHHFMEVRRNGSEIYKHPRPKGADMLLDGQRLPNGQILFLSFNGTLTILQGPSGKVLHSIKSGLPGCCSARRLRNGHYLVSSYEQDKVREIDHTGKVYWEYALKDAYHAEELPNGHFLISSHGLKKIQEVTRSKQVVREIDVGKKIWRVHQR